MIKLCRRENIEYIKIYQYKYRYIYIYCTQRENDVNRCKTVSKSRSWFRTCYGKQTAYLPQTALVAMEVWFLLSAPNSTSAAWSQAGLSLAALQTGGLSAGCATCLCCSQVQKKSVQPSLTPPRPAVLSYRLSLEHLLFSCTKDLKFFSHLICPLLRNKVQITVHIQVTLYLL